MPKEETTMENMKKNMFFLHAFYTDLKTPGNFDNILEFTTEKLKHWQIYLLER